MYQMFVTTRENKDCPTLTWTLTLKIVILPLNGLKA